MIFDPKIGALYADDGSFIKSIDCPMALRVEDLSVLPNGSPDRHCHACNKTIRCIDAMADSDAQKAVAEDADICVFATSAARHVVVLKPIGEHAWDADGLPVIKTARNLAAMADGQARGYRLDIRRCGESAGFGIRCIVYRHNTTGELWWSGDYRARAPNRGSPSDWGLVADWFLYRADQPFPLAAYLVPPGIERGQRVLLEELRVVRGAEVVGESRRPYRVCRFGEAGTDPARSETPRTRGSTLHGNREIPRPSASRWEASRAERIVKPKGTRR